MARGPLIRGLPAALAPFRRSGPLFRRSSAASRAVSSSVSYTALKRTGASVTPQGKLRVPLLKSPSHLGHYTSRVNRMYNEDKYLAGVLQLPENRTVFNFSIFDGHGGDQCLTFLSKNLAEEVENATSLAQSAEARDELAKKYWKNVGGYWKRWYKSREETFSKMGSGQNDMVLAGLGSGAVDLKMRLPLAFLQTDYDFFGQEDNASGSTCTSAFLETLFAEEEALPVLEKYYFNRKTVSKLTVAHVGDTKAILVDRHGEAHALTQSHHPSNPIESARLRRYATNFFMTDSFGEERFIALANTRAFGDLKFKEMGVTAEPDITQVIVGDKETISSRLSADEVKKYTVGGHGGDEGFLLLCSDGITNELTDQEIGDIVMSHVNMKGAGATPQACAEEVVKFIEYIGGDDNATVLVVRLSGWGKWPGVDRTGELRQERMNAYTPRDRN